MEAGKEENEEKSAALLCTFSLRFTPRRELTHQFFFVSVLDFPAVSPEGEPLVSPVSLPLDGAVGLCG